MMPRSIDFASAVLVNDLFGLTMGQRGTITYGGPNGPCFVPAITANLAGRLGFRMGVIGSIQSDFDDLLNLTFGMPFEPAGAWGGGEYIVDTTRKKFGGQGLNIFFTGVSDHYTYAEVDDGNTIVRCWADLIGDAARVEWQLENRDTAAAHPMGLWFGEWMAMLNKFDEDSGFGSRGNYVLTPGERPWESPDLGSLDKRWIRTDDPSAFPPYVFFGFSQRDAYGMVVDNGPTPATTDSHGLNSDASSADEFVIGDAGLLLGAPNGNQTPYPDLILPDTDTGDTAFIQKFNTSTVLPNTFRRIVQYFHTTWGISNYSRPYSVILDSPKILGNDPSGVNGLSNNPFTLRVYIDNTKGFSTNRQDIEIDDVKVLLTLPAGLTLAPGETFQKVIPRILPRQMGFVDYQVQADGITFGDVQYTVKVTPVPGPIKTLNGKITLAATPRIALEPAANLITEPFLFPDSSWEVVLGLSQPTDFVAYEWDPQQKGYILSTSASRGKGTFIIYNGGAPLSQPLSGNPSAPTDISSGAPLIQLKSGWNLIGDPYPYAFPLGQIVGVSASNPTQSYPWKELVNQGVVSSFMSYWDPITQSYKFISDPASNVDPNRGYWVFVYTAQDLTLEFPPIFQPFLPEGTRSIQPWVQTDKQWRLNIQARTNKGVDDFNYVGIAADAKASRVLAMPKPPMAPAKVQDVSVSIHGTVAGNPMLLAQSLNAGSGNQEWRVSVDSTSAGPVTLTWPNLSTIPKNVRVKLVDLSTNSTRDLRQTSGYTFTAAAGSTREFKIQIEPGAGAGPAVIGNVVVQQSTRGDATVAINYTLSRAANTSIRILSAGGREIRSLRAGRAENAGANTATWNLQDSASRNVAPGTYRVEILAETSSGERVRRVVPINVIRG